MSWKLLLTVIIRCYFLHEVNRVSKLLQSPQVGIDDDSWWEGDANGLSCWNHLKSKRPVRVWVPMWIIPWRGGGGALEHVTQVPRSLRPPLVVAHLSLPQRFWGLGVSAGVRSCFATTLGASWSLETLYDMELISRQKHSYSQLHSVGNMQCAVSPWHCGSMSFYYAHCQSSQASSPSNCKTDAEDVRHHYPLQNEIKAKCPALIRTLLWWERWEECGVHTQERVNPRLFNIYTWANMSLCNVVFLTLLHEYKLNNCHM